MKKLLSIFLSIFLLLGILFIPASAVSFPDVSYKEKNSTVYTFSGLTDESTYHNGSIEVNENCYKFTTQAQKSNEVPTIELPIKLEAGKRYQVSFDYSTNGDSAYFREISLYSGNDGKLYNGEVDMTVQANFSNNDNLLATTNSTHTHSGTASLHGKDYQTKTLIFETNEINVPNDGCYLHLGTTYGVYSTQLRVKNIVVEVITSSNYFSGKTDESTWKSTNGSVSSDGEWYKLNTDTQKSENATSFELPYKLQANHTYQISFDYTTGQYMREISLYSGNDGILYDGTTDMNGSNFKNNSYLLYTTNTTHTHGAGAGQSLNGSGTKSFTVTTNSTNVPNDNCYLHIGAVYGVYTTEIKIKNIKIYDITYGRVLDLTDSSDIKSSTSQNNCLTFTHKTDESTGNGYYNISGSGDNVYRAGFMTNYKLEPGASYRVTFDYTQRGFGFAWFVPRACGTISTDNAENRIDNSSLAQATIPTVDTSDEANVGKIENGKATFYIDGSDTSGLTDGNNYLTFAFKIYTNRGYDMDIDNITVTKFDFDNGDINHDLNVENKDLSLLRQKLLGYDITAKGDFDITGTDGVDIRDLVTLYRLIENN